MNAGNGNRLEGDKHRRDRREFLIGAIRWLLAGAGTAAIAALARKPGETCTNQSVCRTCGVSATCGLPQALSFRAVESRPAEAAGAQGERRA